MKTVPIKVYEQFRQDTDDFYAAHLPLLRQGSICLTDFISASAAFEQQAIELSTISTSDFEEYRCFYRRCFLHGGEECIQHEGLHGKVAVQYGLSPTYCLMLATDYGIRLDPDRGIVAAEEKDARKRLIDHSFTIDGLAQGGFDWSLDRFFEYLKATLDAVSASASKSDLILKHCIR